MRWNGCEVDSGDLGWVARLAWLRREGKERKEERGGGRGKGKGKGKGKEESKKVTKQS